MYHSLNVSIKVPFTTCFQIQLDSYTLSLNNKEQIQIFNLMPVHDIGHFKTGIFAPFKLSYEFFCSFFVVIVVRQGFSLSLEIWKLFWNLLCGPECP